MAAPSVIASVKASATRSSVTPRLKNSAPERASVMTAVRTAGGAGSFAGPMSSAAIHQLARNTANDNRRTTSVSGYRAVEGAAFELRRRPDQFAPADFSQHAVKNARVGLFIGDRPAWDAFAITVAIGAQRGRVGRAGQRRDGVPFRIRGRQDLLGLAADRDEARDHIAV